MFHSRAYAKDSSGSHRWKVIEDLPILYVQDEMSQRDGRKITVKCTVRDDERKFVNA